MTLKVRKARIRESLCWLNILIPFIRERLCHLFFNFFFSEEIETFDQKL